MGFDIPDIQEAISKLPAHGTTEYPTCYAELFYRVVTEAVDATFKSTGIKILKLRPKELGYGRKSDWRYYKDTQIQTIRLFYSVLKSAKFSQLDFTGCGALDLSGLNLAENPTITRETIEQAIDLKGTVFPAIDLTGCDLTDKQLSGSDLSRVTGLKAENIFPNYADSKWSPNYVARAYRNVKFPGIDMAGVNMRNLYIKNCTGLRNLGENITRYKDFEEYRKLHKYERPCRPSGYKFIKPFTVPTNKAYFFSGCDLTLAVFKNRRQVQRLEGCQISLDTYRQFFRAKKYYLELMGSYNITCPELTRIVSEIAAAIKAVCPTFRDVEKITWEKEHLGEWDVASIYSDFQKNPSTVKRLLLPLI